MTLRAEDAFAGLSAGVEDALGRALDEALASGQTTLVALPAPIAPSEALLFGQTGDAVAWTAPNGGLELAALGNAAVLEGHGRSRFTSVGRAGRELLRGVRSVGLFGASAVVPRVVGGFAFRDGEPGASFWQPFGEARFVLPELAYVVDAGGARLVVAATPERLARPGARDGLIAGTTRALDVLARGFEPGPTSIRHRRLEERPDTEWAALIESIRGEIARETLEKVVLSRRVSLTLDLAPEPAEVLFRLRKQAPECTRFLIRKDGVTFLGATPEWLAQKTGSLLETGAVAGSMGALEPDARERLLTSEKDQREHAFVLREILHALEPLAERLEHAATPEIYELRHVLHLRTRVAATLKGTPHLLDLVERLHPTPAVGGVPTLRALEWIHSHEPDERGWYAGPVGWFDPAGDGQMAVAIRSGVLSGKVAHLYAGCGIVKGSAPAAEFTETRWKLRTLLGALGVAE